MDTSTGWFAEHVGRDAQLEWRVSTQQRFCEVAQEYRSRLRTYYKLHDKIVEMQRRGSLRIYACLPESAPV